jgi:hypothetical protein
MSEIQSVVNSLIGRISTVDPAMLSIVQEIVNELERIGIIVDPAPIISNKISSVTRDTPPVVTDFSYRFTPDNLILEWSPPSINFLFYEIRKGTIWSSAEFVTTTSNIQLFLDPILVGTTRYLNRSLSTQGIYSASVASVDVIVPPIGNVQLSATQISNNVLLKWTVPTSTFRIVEYIITKDGLEVGRISGTFFAIFETTGGVYNYGVSGVDLAGNVGLETVIAVSVTDPDNFILRSEFTSSFSGVKVNAKETDVPSLLVCVNNVDTVDDHFTNYSWTTPQDQIDDGYVRWLSPFETTASYQEEFDCGGIHNNVIVTLAWSSFNITGTFTIGFSTRVSDDGITWSSPEVGQSFFAASVRYIEVTIQFTAANDLSLLEFFNFQVSVSVRQDMDSGAIDADSTDVDGTVALFNKAFKDVDSITATVLTTTGEYIAVVIFDDIPNPTEFAVMVFDSAGARADKTVYWKARGVI